MQCWHFQYYHLIVNVVGELPLTGKWSITLFCYCHLLHITLPRKKKNTKTINLWTLCFLLLYESHLNRAFFDHHILVVASGRQLSDWQAGITKMECTFRNQYCARNFKVSFLPGGTNYIWGRNAICFSKRNRHRKKV